MKEITGDEFRDLLQSDVPEIKDYRINIEKPNFISIKKLSSKNKVTNCSFTGRLEFFDPLFASNKDFIHSFEFNNCSFDIVVISNCYFQELSFNNLQKVENFFSVSDCDINFFSINHTAILNKNININHNRFLREFSLKAIKINDASLKLTKNDFPKQTNNFTHTCVISKCELNKYEISNNDFGHEIIFTENIATHSSITDSIFHSSFKDCTFGRSSFRGTSFGRLSSFKNCFFNDIASFEKTGNSFETSLSLSNCIFKKTTSFNGTFIKHLHIKDSTFENLASFQDTYFHTISIDRTIFEKYVLFDNIKIKEIYNCSRITIRTIKQQLQKAENKIDYNRFRAYELSAYYQELNWKWKADFKDKFILWATKHVTGFDHSWRKALRFTLIVCLVFYSLFFISENYSYPFDFSYYREFLSGAFRFLLVTDFYNPLSDGRNYIDSTNTIGWFIFILGKIVIAFGIYEMIQAFRKFKA